MIETKRKVIIIDDASFIRYTRIRSKFSNNSQGEFIPYCNSLFACLRRLNLSYNDIIIFVGISDVSKLIIGNTEGIYQITNSEINYKIIIASIADYFKNDEVIIITYEKDLGILAAKDNVKIFSPYRKFYLDIKNPYKCLAESTNKYLAIKKQATPIDSYNVKSYEVALEKVDLLNINEDIKTKVNRNLWQIATNNLIIIKDRNNYFTNKLRDVFNKPIKADYPKKKKRKVNQLLLF